MNFILRPGSNVRMSNNGVQVNGSTELTSGIMSVGGNLTNSGKIKIGNGGNLKVEKDVLNTGDILINDPEKIKQIIIETIKTAGSVADFGTEFLKRIGLVS